MGDAAEPLGNDVPQATRDSEGVAGRCQSDRFDVRAAFNDQATRAGHGRALGGGIQAGDLCGHGPLWSVSLLLNMILTEQQPADVDQAMMREALLLASEAMRAG